MQPKDYKDNFFEYHLQGAVNSAKAVIPVVRDYIMPASVIDIGCGIGAWLSVWKSTGVAAVFGVDGEHVDSTKLVIDGSEFKAFDLSKIYATDKKYDLVTCLEVAEHLPSNVADKFVASLCSLGDVILFSAAIPGQEGTMHINEQYPEYWIAIFKKNKYVAIDCIRHRIWNDKTIQWWYRQNIMFFVREDTLPKYPSLKKAHDENKGDVLSLVHPELLDFKEHKVNYYESVLRSSSATLKYFFNYLFKKKADERREY